MSRITDSKCKICRRSQTKLFLKGDRCYTEKCALSRRQTLPGQSTGFSRRLSNYGQRLRAKQNVKKVYGLNETQMKNVFNKAKQSGGDKGLKMLQLLELRLDNVVYLLGFSPSRAAARQAVNHGKFSVNDRKSNIPSRVLKVGDKVSLYDKNFVSNPASNVKTPAWIKKNKSGGEIVTIPERSMISEEIKENLIIEFYSR
ncbi:30S ribosomal protein S4 [Candidatus Dojkabacteria bacterium]|nr:30S ribosomal protein S4 [Candidatus Dojkabacteria bacterium]